jgi:hypothetical protein
MTACAASRVMSRRTNERVGRERHHVMEITIKASAERIFEALTDRDQRVKWWGIQDRFQVSHAASDLRPGGKWTMRGGRTRRCGGAHRDRRRCRRDFTAASSARRRPAAGLGRSDPLGRLQPQLLLREDAALPRKWGAVEPLQTIAAIAQHLDNAGFADKRPSTGPAEFHPILQVEGGIGQSRAPGERGCVLLSPTIPIWLTRCKLRLGAVRRPPGQCNKPRSSWRLSWLAM